MIPKIIHYCWFGGNPLPPLAVKCLESWKKYCPDYEIKQWNENNFDINFNTYTKEAYEEKKWAFVSDVARLYAVYSDGGVYFDTDVEMIKPIDCFLSNSMFLGFESLNHVNTGLGFGAKKNFYLVERLLAAYEGQSFIDHNGTNNTTPCPVYNSAAIRQEGFLLNNTMQTKNNVTLYPIEYFCPKDGKTGNVTITENTYAIHHFDGSWLTDEQKQEYILITEYRNKYGRILGEIIYTVIAICTFRKSGISNIVEKTKSRVISRTRISVR